MCDEEYVRSFCKHTYSFILRFWLEPREIEDAEPEWRGEVEHVAAGKRVYFSSLEELKQILGSYVPGIAGAEKGQHREHAQQ